MVSGLPSSIVTTDELLHGPSTLLLEPLSELVTDAPLDLQIGLETVIQYDLGLPNAIYLDAVDRGGLVRTGTELFPEPGTGGNPPPSTHKTTGYAYVDTVLYYNVREACKSAAANDAACDSLLALLASRRKMNPYQRWDNPAAGRLSTFPPLPLPLSSR